MPYGRDSATVSRVIRNRPSILYSLAQQASTELSFKQIHTQGSSKLLTCACHAHSSCDHGAFSHGTELSMAQGVSRRQRAEYLDPATGDCLRTVTTRRVDLSILPYRDCDVGACFHMRIVAKRYQDFLRAFCAASPNIVLCFANLEYIAATSFLLLYFIQTLFIFVFIVQVQRCW
jgi:hypothetical protein